MTLPAVSIIMPTFNRLHYLRPAVDSVFAQTFEDWELIIADDGSGAETTAYLRSLAEQPRVRVLSLQHTANQSAVRNAGLRAARAACIAFLDSDDLWLPRKLEIQLASLRAHAARRWSYTDWVAVDRHCDPLVGTQASRRPVNKDGWVLDQLLTGEASIVQPALMASRELILAAGGYPEDLPLVGDYELYVQMARRSEIDFVDSPLVLVRRHDEHSCDDVAALNDLARFLHKMQQAGVAVHMDATLRARRAQVAVNLARNYAVSGDLPRLFDSLASSAHYSWRHRLWWYGAANAIARAIAPQWARTAVRAYRTL
jgi:hypothetical protein